MMQHEPTLQQLRIALNQMGEASSAADSVRHALVAAQYAQQVREQMIAQQDAEARSR